VNISLVLISIGLYLHVTLYNRTVLIFDVAFQLLLLKCC